MAIDTSAPSVPEARVAGHLRHLIRAATARTPDLGDLRVAVREAFEAGESWEVIGMALGISPAEARARFG